MVTPDASDTRRSGTVRYLRTRRHITSWSGVVSFAACYVRLAFNNPSGAVRVCNMEMRDGVCRKDVLSHRARTEFDERVWSKV